MPCYRAEDCQIWPEAADQYYGPSPIDNFINFIVQCLQTLSYLKVCVSLLCRRKVTKLLSSLPPFSARLKMPFSVNWKLAGISIFLVF